jgi:hypothetical protein
MISSTFVVYVALATQFGSTTVIPVRPGIDLQIQELSTHRTEGVRAFVATYGSGPSRAQFEVRMLLPSDADSPGPCMTTISLHRRPPSDPRAFLEELVVLHDVQPVGLAVQHRDSLSVGAVLVERHLTRSRRSDGSDYLAKSSDGTWFLMRLRVFPDSLAPSEILLALSPLTGALIPLGRENGLHVVSALSGLLMP